MLTPLSSPDSIASDTHFYDPFQRTLYSIDKGCLTAHLQTHNESHPIPISLSSTLPSSPPLPSLMVLSGEAVRNAQANMVTSSSGQVRVRSTVEVQDHSHWQWHVPLSLSSVELGLYFSRGQKGDEFEQLISFNSSTSRTVSFWLNGKELNVWINGTKPHKKAIKIINQDVNAVKCYPFAKIKEKGSSLIFVPFLTTSVLPISPYNPFGVLCLQAPPLNQQSPSFPQKEVKLTRLIPLSEHKMLLIFQNNRIRVVSRNKDHQFSFGTSSVDESNVYNLFREDQYELLKKWRQDNKLFAWSSGLSIQFAFQWIRYLISELDHSNSERSDLYTLLLNKLIIIRPYLKQAGIQFPNLLLHCSADIEHYLSALNYFSGFLNLKSSLLNLSSPAPEQQVEGDILSFTQNYLLSLKEGTVIVYYLGSCIKEVFRQKMEKFNFNKRSLVSSYNEKDLRCLQKEGSYLYKILSSALNSTGEQQVHKVDSEGVKELTEVFKVEEALARTALENTGNVEEALVWIFGKKKDKTNKQEMIQESKDGSHTFGLFQVKTIFTRLMISVNHKVFLLGVTPNQIHQWIHKKDNEFIDLNSFKHQYSLEEINFHKWYEGPNHPLLHILDCSQLSTTPQLLIRQNNKLYAVLANAEGRHKQEISIKQSQLFEQTTSLYIQEQSEKLAPEFQHGALIRSIQGELISSSVEERAYLPGTTVLINKKLYSNSTLMGVTALRITIKADPSLFLQPAGSTKTLPLTIEQCPPGVNKNYSISSLLISNSSFLGNYPQGIMMRHLHNLVMNVTSFKLRRCVNRKNVNYIERGWIIFKDAWGYSSQKHQFKFEPDQEEVTLTFDQGQYWKSIYLEPKFTSQKKLPFEIGSFAFTGSTMCPEVYREECQRKLSSILNSQSSQKIFLLGLTAQSRTTFKLDIRCANMEALEDFTIKNDKFDLVKKEGVTIPKQTSGFDQIEAGSPDQIIKFMTKNYTNIQAFLRYLAKSSSFKFDSFDQKNVRKFVDLAIFTPQVIQDEEYYPLMFSKLWNNAHAQEYLLKFAVAFCEVPLIPLKFLKLVLSHLPPDYHQLTLKAALECIQDTRKKEYQSLNSDSPYLYFQTQFYSDYYMSLVNPDNKDLKTRIYNEPCIKAEVLVFKSDYTRRIITKLPAKYAITNVTLRAERCDISSKIRYTVFALTPSGKEPLGSGFLLEHQWSQITKLPYRPEVDKVYDCNSTALNMIGLDLPRIRAQYLEIELSFTENGVVAHQSQLSRIAQVDILPELYGYQIEQPQVLARIDNFLNFNPEDMFFLSMSSLLETPMKKYSVSSDKNIQFIYFVPHKEDIGALKALLVQKIEKKQLEVIVSIQKKLINNKQFSLKVSLDYLYTLIALTFTQLQKGTIRISDNICEKIFKVLIQGAQGPIKMMAFQVVSHKINLLINSLQYIDKELHSLHNISFSYELLIEVTDFSNSELCKSLTKLILRGVPYQQKWTELLIRMSPRTGTHQEIINYFINQQDWLGNNQILDYLSSLPDQIYINHFLANLSFKHLSKMVLSPTAKPRLDVLLETIVSRASDKNLVDLDVIGLIFQQREIRWEQLETVINSCPEAADTVIYQFLQSDTPEILAREHNFLFSSAASVKYCEEFAVFLNRIYHRDKTMLSQLFLGLGNKCTSLHYDFLETIGNFIIELCNFGGIEGAKLLSEKEVENLHAAVQMLKIVEKLPEGAEVPNQDLFIDWYLNNNHYQLTPVNPVNKSPAHHLMKHLIDQVLALIKATDPSKVLEKYMITLNNIKMSKRTSIAKRHLLFNQLHFGASTLLSQTLAPGLLANVLIGGDNTLFARVINELKSATIRNSGKSSKWAPQKELELTEHFDVRNVGDVKDIQVGRAGSKTPAFKVPFSQKTIRITSEESRSATKIAIGFCLNDNAENKAALLPSRVELFAGNDKTMLKIGNMTHIQDQFYFINGVRVFAINLNALSSIGVNPVNNFEFKMYEPQLCSASDVLEGGQRNKKNSSFNISFVSVYGYDCQPAEEPDYSEMYVTLLGFLGNPKYKKDLQSVIASPFFDQKLELIIQVLNDLLPNDDIEALLLSLNKEGENILEHVLKSKGANPRLVNLLLMGRLNKQNINKLIAHTLDNISNDFADIVVTCLRIASYSTPRKVTNSMADFQNVKHLIENYQRNTNYQKLYSKLLNALLTVPNLYNYDMSKVLSYIWNHPHRQLLYPILAAVLPYYPSHLQSCSSKKYVFQLLDELITIMTANQAASTVTTTPQNHLQLLCTLALNQSCLEQLLNKRAPIQMIQLLKSQSSILVKYSSEVMKLFISFFQNTCIGTSCQDQFSQILISIMTSLNQFSPIHHNFFIHNFFFPLINAFKGVPLFFVWKHQDQYLKQVTDVLQFDPIKSNSTIIAFENDFYQPIQSVDQDSYSHTLLFVNKESHKVCFKLNDKMMWDVVARKYRKYSSKQGVISIQLSKDETVLLSPDTYRAYQQNKWEKNLLTNSTLQNLNNPWILQEKYQSIAPIRSSTLERCYFVPTEMEITDILKQINIGGFRIHPSDLAEITVKNYLTGNNIDKNTNFKTILKEQKEPYLKLEIESCQLFKNSTIESLAKEEFAVEPFVTQETIFKAFEQKKGLEKMITVLKGSVNNWTNRQQTTIWSQYLKQLESYSCFPVFSHLYVNRQSNVALLFDILLGLPDKQDNKKWIQKEKESVRELYAIIKDVFAVKGEQATVVREYALKSGFYETMLNRLFLITKEPRRVKCEEIKEEQELLPTIQKKNSEDDYAARLKKRTGVGYGTDSSTNQKWDVTGQEEARKEKSEQILSLLNILEQFLNCPEYSYPTVLLDQTYESSLLPIIESSLRGGSLLQIAKYAQLFKGELSFIDVIAGCKQLVPALMSIPKCYEPKQPQSIFSLLKTLANTSNIFLACLTGSASEKTSEEIAKKITETFKLVEEAVSEYETTHHTEDEEEKRIMELPLQKKYPLLMKDLRFDYVDMKDSSNKITKHHYASYYQPGHKPPVDKTIRLAQELADLSHALPIDHTNAIYVRTDKERVDFMQALIMGSNGTPYGHGAFLFDIYFEDNYPNGPPKVNLMTTGSGQIRFNPNLYACGKVCLSLLGTWRGNAMENWDAKVSTLLQVLVSIQSIIMSEDIYFNEPGFEHQQGTPEGERKNEAYANIVRYGNVKFAMLQNLKNPPKGFESVIRRHFYLKKDQILEQCRKWLKFAQKRQASYTGLISDHNYNWCNNFKKSKSEYKTMLEKAIKELEGELNKLPPPTHSDFAKQASPVKPRRKHLEDIPENKEEINLELVDVSYGSGYQYHELDINDEKVKDRWSRYIGAMGVEAVSKQSKANILLLGLGAVGVETAKNIVMSGCRQFAVWDDKTVKYSDLSGQFYLSEEDIDKPRVESCFYKLQQLNHYVKMTRFQYNPTDLTNLNSFQLVIATERNQEQLLKLDSYCRTNNIHFIAVDCYGPYGQIFNDFGDQFSVLDKDGEEPTQVLIDSISSEERGVVRVVKGYRHPYEDGDTVRIVGVKGMQSQTTEGQSINGTLHTIKVIDHTSFEIGNTTDYSPYEGQGTVKNIKTPKQLTFQSLQAVNQDPLMEPNLQYYDWSKNNKLKLVHTCFQVLSEFSKQQLRLPFSWNQEDANQFIELLKGKKGELSEEDVKYAKLFSYTCSGTFGPICAFYGGIAAQQAFKAITGKYTPIHQYFISEFSQIIETPPEDEEGWEKYIQSRLPVQNRTEGLRRIVGGDVISKLQNSKVFMVGSGAIGCQLLKNFAMLELATGEGSIVVTDPDHIQNSNLNRQFLFREKHLRKPKSVTASAAAIQMNPRLKGHIKAKLDKVCETTRELFNNQFFEEQTIVANALDNVQARRYVDSRCLQSKIPMLQSGTLSSKGHVQVVIPYKTQTYGSMQDPGDAQGEIPHCTLKMFPEETLHCVEWARDLFGKEFTLGPKALKKLLEAEEGYAVGPSDIQMLRQCKTLIQSKPHSFDDAIEEATKVFYKLFRNDIMQLLYTYPLDATTKDGKPFWKLPKRPPTPIEEIDPKDPLHNTFIASYSVLLAKVNGIPYPKDFRSHERREEIAESARSIKVEPFQPSDKMAKEMAEEVDSEAVEKEEKKEMEEKESEYGNEQVVYAKFKEVVKNLQESGETVEAHPEEFEKDDDQNGHIDVISSMANLRARNYKLEEMEWITVKLKAGRIMPALSTTTSCIAALQSIELVKYLCGCPLESMRNAFLNLAIPSLAMSEPGPVEKIKVHETLETNIWQRWTVGPLGRQQTLGEFIGSIEDKYGVKVKGLTLPECGQIYYDFMLSLQSKKEEKEKLLGKKLSKLVESEMGDDPCKYLDFTLVMGVGQTLINHAPTLRLILSD